MKKQSTAQPEVEPTGWSNFLAQCGEQIQWFQSSIHPNSGHYLFDLILILGVAAFQETVLSSILGPDLRIDLLTPWLMVNVVLQSTSRAMFLAVFAGFVLENHSSVPAGTYICIYWILAGALSLTKDSISWRHPVPWIILLLCGQLWCVMAEGFIATAVSGEADIDWYTLALYQFRIVSSSAFGLYLIFRALHRLQEGKPIA